MTTVRQSRTTSFFTLLNTSAPVGVPPIRRVLSNADIDPNAVPDQFPDMVMAKSDDTIQEKTRDPGEPRRTRATGLGGLEYRQLRIGFIGWFEGTDSVPCDDAPEPTLAWIKKCANAMKKAGLVHRAVVEQIGFHPSTSGQVPRCRVVAMAILDYQVRTDDDEQWA